MNKMLIVLAVLAVNGQEGFFIDDKNNIIAAYSHHRKAVVFKEGCPPDMFQLPENYRDYENFGYVGHFCVGFWDFATGDNSDFALIQPRQKRVTEEEEA